MLPKNLIDGDGETLELAEDDHHLDADYDWCVNDPAVLRRHGGQMVVAQHGKVWWAGDGRTDVWKAAEEKARRNGEKLPPRDELVVLMVPYLLVDASSEYAWCLEDSTVQAKCGGLVAAVAGREVLGAGMDRAEAWAAAQGRPDCPPESDVAFVLIPDVLYGPPLS